MTTEPKQYFCKCHGHAYLSAKVKGIHEWGQEYQRLLDEKLVVMAAAATTPAKWLALPHSKTWRELVEAGEVPMFMFVGTAAKTSDRPDWNLAANLGIEWTRGSAQPSEDGAEPVSWPTIDDWAAAVGCPTCRAAPGEPCRRPRRQQPLDHWHVARTDKNKHNRDVGKAPFPEERIPGKSYSSIPDRVLAVRQLGEFGPTTATR